MTISSFVIFLAMVIWVAAQGPVGPPEGAPPGPPGGGPPRGGPRGRHMKEMKEKCAKGLTPEEATAMDADGVKKEECMNSVYPGSKELFKACWTETMKSDMPEKGSEVFKIMCDPEKGKLMHQSMKCGMQKLVESEQAKDPKADFRTVMGKMHEKCPMGPRRGGPGGPPPPPPEGEPPKP